MVSPGAGDPFAHRARRRWRRLVVEVPSEFVEAAADAVAAVTGGGVEIAPAPPGPDRSAREQVIGYLDEDERADDREMLLRREMEALGTRPGAAGIVVGRAAPLLEEDWGAGWKRHFRPFHASERLVIKPSWEAYAPRAGEAVIEMDPGMAFGTGLHASTRLALGFVEEVCAAAPPARALDVGTGTGVLAMAAALRGAARVIAIDSDPDAVAAARGNVRRNGLASRIEVGGRPVGAIPGTFDLVVANITADVLLALAPAIASRLAPGGALVLAGLLAGEQSAETAAAYGRLGLLGALERAEGEWAALLLARPDGGEVFEVVDGGGRVVGRAPRSLCHRMPALAHRSAHVIVTDGGGRIYLQKRSGAKDLHPGKWDISVGGHLAPGEGHEAGARRELAEELGLAGGLRFLHRFTWRGERETELVETWLHEAGRQPRPNPEEIEEGRWFTPAEAAALVDAGEATPVLAEELRRLRGGAT